MHACRGDESLLVEIYTTAAAAAEAVNAVRTYEEHGKRKSATLEISNLTLQICETAQWSRPQICYYTGENLPTTTNVEVVALFCFPKC